MAQSEQEKKYLIKSAIENFSRNNLTSQSIHLFQTLGYNTRVQDPFLEKDYKQFHYNYSEYFSEKGFNEEKALTKEWQYIDLLFQLTKSEVSTQSTLFHTGKVKWQGEDKETVIETYLFFAIGLRKNEYSRTELAQITRETNKLFPMPVMLIFKYGDKLTLAIINRRLHKKDSQKDVLEKVTLIKDISISTPHRAHIEILFDLSLEELRRKYRFTNFVELHNAWQETLDTKELNKKFYRELSNWYFWAMNKVSFPNDPEDDTDNTKYNAESVIRLITRLIFIWFIKEKKLIPENIFDKNELSKILKGFGEKDSKVYYRAILQNLFFATLNQKIEDRKFANDGGFLKERVDYGVKTLYRYADDFLLSKDDAISLFKEVPFLNGGLFDCLDDQKHEGKLVDFDGFSRNPKKQAQVPDELFFTQEKTVDLSEAYFDQRKKNEKVKGLFNIFNNYKFTITENTPIEEEVALDPELLGRVFENLLASYNPETKTTARKQSGSFYTPREIVNYMVDESLKAYLKQKLETEAHMSTEDAECGLEVLLEYTEKEHLFNIKETEILLHAIDNCKIIDPACGSGAFPMGILHKLVFILQKLDPKNEIWKKIQLEKAREEAETIFQIEDKEEREKRLIDINNTFDESINNPDYARKLFLIENCIYGVDIQPIATQISKLRFFISLVVDQKPDIDKDNFGIIPLPNLELKFVTANTLIDIDKPQGQGILLDSPEVKELEKTLKDTRHRLFNARTSTSKQRIREKDRRVRNEMSNILQNSGWSNKSARQLSNWDPYDQNASSPFFDPEWMFGIKDGFDIVIANPPYLKERENKRLFEAVNRTSWGKRWHQGKMDYWYFFLHKGIDLTHRKSIISFITSRYWLNSTGARKLIKRIHDELIFVNFVDIGKVKVFDEVAGQHMIATYSKDKKCECFIYKKLNNNLNDIFNKEESENLKIEKLSNKKIFSDNWEILLHSSKEYDNTVRLGSICDISQGVVEAIDKVSKKTLENKHIEGVSIGDGVFVLTKNELDKLNLNKLEKDTIKRYLDPNDVYKWNINKKANKFLIFSDKYVKNKIKEDKNYSNLKRHLDKFRKVITSSNAPYGLHRPRQIKYFNRMKIIFKNMFATPEFTYDEEKYFFGFSFSSIIERDKNFDLKYILALLNSSFALLWYKRNCKKRGIGFDVGVQKIRNFPIKKITNNEQIPFIELVNKIFNITKTDDYLENTDKQAQVREYEKQIDQLVYKLYELTPEEIKIVENFKK